MTTVSTQDAFILASFSRQERLGRGPGRKAGKRAREEGYHYLVLHCCESRLTMDARIYFV